MNTKQIETIKKRLGTADAPQFIAKLESLGVGEDVIINGDEISILKSVVKDLSALQHELSTLSTVGRAFPLSEKNDRIKIDIVVYHKEFLGDYQSAMIGSIDSDGLCEFPLEIHSNLEQRLGSSLPAPAPMVSQFHNYRSSSAIQRLALERAVLEPTPYTSHLGRVKPMD